MSSSPPGRLCEALGADRGGLVSLVGGGGKTTALYRLVREWGDLGLRAAAATTTRVAVPGAGEPELGVGETWEALREAAGARRPRGTVLGRGLVAPGKVAGIPPEWCDRLVAEGVVEALAVEADGARRLPVKAPGEAEPVVPESTTVFVAVVGLSCLGTPLDAEHAFRPERIGRLTGLAPGSRIDPRSLVRLLRAPGGLGKGRPPGATAVALLNQADVPGGAQAAAELARGLLVPAGGYDRVVLAALRTPEAIRRVWVG